MKPKIPPGKMPEDELIQWVFENDFDYWARVYVESGGASMERLEELFRQEVYDTIDDEVGYGEVYIDYLEEDEDNDDE